MTCSKCLDSELTINDFYIKKERNKPGTICKKCVHIRQMEWREKNKDKVRQQVLRSLENQKKKRLENKQPRKKRVLSDESLLRLEKQKEETKIRRELASKEKKEINKNKIAIIKDFYRCRTCKQDKKVDEFYIYEKGCCKKCKIQRSSKNKSIKSVKKRDDYAVLRFVIGDILIIKHKVFKNKNILKVRNDLKKARKEEGKIITKLKPKKITEKAKERRRNCHKSKIRKIISKSLKSGGYTKNSQTFEILGCEYEVFRKHIERQFTEGMNWDNYGLYGWHYDHIMPLSTAKSYEDIVRLNHYTNLRPLWAKENITKSDNIIEHQVKLPI